MISDNKLMPEWKTAVKLRSLATAGISVSESGTPKALSQSRNKQPKLNKNVNSLTQLAHRFPTQDLKDICMSPAIKFRKAPLPPKPRPPQADKLALTQSSFNLPESRPPSKSFPHTP